MHLKTLELQGFKSFADKTALDLQTGIVAVVGPNGSGKSNIVEAVRWVLGEQSAKSLRGRKMEDVIFSGTKKRPALGVAEVSLILDNSDYALPLEYTEVKVTRRLYRSGEGEYLLNGRHCRLKDIQRLFDDSGLGGDGYAIIAQGRIVELLAAKPEERRSLVEETAGIVKYRERKKEALRKIEGAEQNLLRLADIMSEIEGRLKPLQRDAANAEQYLAFQRQLDEISIALLAADGLAVHERLTELAARERAENDRYEELRGAVLGHETALAEKRTALQLLNDDCERARQQLHQMESEIQRGEGELQSLASRLLGYEEKEALLTTEIDSLTAKAATLSAALTEERAKFQAAEGELAAIGERLSLVESRRASEEEDLLNAEKAMTALREEAFERAREVSQQKNRQLALEQKIAGDQRRLQAIGQKFAAHVEEEGILDQRIGEIANFIDGLAAEEAALAERVVRYQQELAAEKERINAKREEIVTRKMETSRLESRLRTLEELVLRREGFYPGVKGVLEEKARGGLPSILGVIAELVTVEKAYTVAVEAVLGGALQNLVAETGEDAARAVSWLKETKKGIATFLPLDMLRRDESRAVPAKISNHPAFLGAAIDHVKAPIKVQPAITYLLHNTLIFQTLADGIELAREFKGRFRIVTLDGDIINTGGAVSGGSRDKKRGGLLQRQTEIEELRRQIIEGGKIEKQLTTEIEAIAEHRENIKRKLDELDRKKQDLSREKQAFDGEIKNIDTRREIYQRDVEALTVEQAQIEQELAADREEGGTVAEQIRLAKAEEARLLQAITEQEAAFRDAKLSESKMRDEYTEIQVAYAAQKSAVENNRFQLERLTAEEAEIATRRAEQERGRAQTADELTACREKQTSLQAEVMAKRHQLAADMQKLERQTGERDSLSQLVNVLEKETQALRKQEGEQRDLLHQTGLKKERLLSEQSQIEEKLQEQFQLTLAEALPYRREDLSRTAGREQVKTLKEQISVLGPINLGAIEEYQAVSERYDFLCGQRDDVLAAKDSLARVINQIDDIIVERFRETFDQINRSFQETFPGFFQGGAGELRLTDPDDLLMSGVEIMVQPPGKRVQHHNLLSGGEKSLAGIALLFAVLKVKPSPFYVLDEIDAALDDANVDKFAAYLAQYGDESQFLVITHRQGTMEAAAELYGITMAEEGISKTVSVRLVDR